MRKILFLDGDARSTLALIRDISELDSYDIYTACHSPKNLSSRSKHSKKSYVYHDPKLNKELFERDLKRINLELNPDIIIPSTDISYLAIYETELYELLKNKLVMPDKKAFYLTFNKDELDKAAINAGIKIIPRVNKKNLIYPFVLKPRFSRYYVGNTMSHGFRAFINNEEEYSYNLQAISEFDTSPIYQKVVDGNGYGVFVAAKDGEIFKWFAHERIREYPIKGGASTYRKSIIVDDKLKIICSRLIKELQWNGIAMIEFKGHIEHDLYLMEVNGRPWGSMGLAISSGVPFGKILLDVFHQEIKLNDLMEKYKNNYELEHYSRWIAGEILYLRALKSYNVSLNDKFKLIKEVFKKGSSKTSYDTYNREDPMPALFEVMNAIFEPILNRLKK